MQPEASRGFHSTLTQAANPEPSQQGTHSSGVHPEFLLGGGGGADSKAIYNLFDFKIYVIKIM
jgi:hypothetical protein